MSKSPSKESDIPALSHIAILIGRNSSVVDSACDANQNSHGSIPPWTEFLSAEFPESSLLGTSIDLQSSLTLLLSRMDKMESNIVNVTKTNNLLQEKITSQEQDKVSLHSDSSEYQGDDLDHEVRPSSEELHPVNTEIDLTAGEIVRDQAEVVSTGKYSLVDDLFNQNSPVPKTSGHLSSYSPSQDVKAAHSSSSKRKLDDENDLNVGNEIIDQTVTEKESHQVYGPQY